jgi:hypothetical protein
MYATTTSEQQVKEKQENRAKVEASYARAVEANQRRFLKGNVRATEEYIYANQKSDAQQIVDAFTLRDRCAISITKKTKVGMDGLMIQIAYLMTTHVEDSFVIDPANVRILTGMNNRGWQDDMMEKAPDCFRNQIYHHGRLRQAKLGGLKNALIIIDEIDTGDKQMQVLHRMLREAGLFDINYIRDNNVRFIFASATMLRELYDLDKWGEHHELYRMTIPAQYVGHADFLERGILAEFYALDSEATAMRWVKDDIIDYYHDDATDTDDFRVHIVRLNTDSEPCIRRACNKYGVAFRMHNSEERLSNSAISEIFATESYSPTGKQLQRHVVLGIKGFFRRANLIPNAWKMRIGATHERWTKQIDNNVQIQGLPGRMSGYWRDILDAGHKTGPHRTSIQAVEEYEATYLDPFGENSYRAAGFSKKADGKVRCKGTMVAPKNIRGLALLDEELELPIFAIEDKDLNREEKQEEKQEEEDRRIVEELLQEMVEAVVLESQ